jgi:hypothetical protein
MIARSISTRYVQRFPTQYIHQEKVLTSSIHDTQYHDQVNRFSASSQLVRIIFSNMKS